MSQDIEIEAFRADTPASKGITAAQALEAVQGYDATRNPAPVVMGHPADDQSAPAFGAISAARMDGNRLFVKIKNFAQEAIDGVRQSRILNRSMAFWHPDHPSNPNPGKLSLRHLGLLGGAAPAIPNMAPLHFGADDQLVAEGEPGVAVIFAAADKPQLADLLDDNAIKGIASAVAAILKPKGKEFGVTEEELKAKETQLAADAAALAEREQAVKDKETQFAADEEQRAKDAKAARETANTEFAAQLVQDGKFPAGHKDDLVSILNALPVETLQFSGDAKEAPAEALKRILGGATPVFQFGVHSPAGNPPAAGGADDAEAQALAAANAKQANKWNGGA